MNSSRPIGHIAGLLSYTALHICFRIAQRPHDAVHVCWVTDDGCVYLEQAATPAARAIARHAPEQVLARYRQHPALTWRDVESDLLEARKAFISRTMAEALSV